MNEHEPDMVLFDGGAPCSQLSIAAADRSGFDGTDSSLFWVFINTLANVTLVAVLFATPIAMLAATPYRDGGCHPHRNAGCHQIDQSSLD